MASPKLQTEILISASSESVWAVLTDFERYPEWNPLLPKARGELAPGKRLHAMAVIGWFIRFPIRPQIVVARPPTELRWRGHLPIPGLFAGEHFFRIEPNGNGQVRLVHGEVYEGVLRYPFYHLVGGITRSAFGGMNRALKQRVESV